MNYNYKGVGEIIGISKLNPSFIVYDLINRSTSYSFSQVDQLSSQLANSLVASGIKRQDRVIIMLNDPLPFLVTFLGTCKAGAITVPIHVRAGLAKEDVFIEQTRHIINDCSPVCIIHSGSFKHDSDLQSFAYTHLIENNKQESPTEGLDLRDSIALLQYTSGSTGNPKGVIITHQNLLANLGMISEGLHAQDGDSSLSWLPLNHDMGLIGGLLAPIARKLNTYLMPTESFVARPLRWPQNLSDKKITFSAGPNFAFSLIMKIVERQTAPIENLDLRHVKALVCGAERCDYQTAMAFTKHFAKYGLRNEAITPAYGLAECTLLVSLKNYLVPFKVLSFNQEQFVVDGVIGPCNDESSTQKIVSVGAPAPGVEIQIRDENRNILAPGKCGEIMVKGPSNTSGYWNNHKTNFDLFDNQWLRTGDLGFFWENELYITGRIKELIINRGRNFHPFDIEKSITMVEGVQEGRCVALSDSNQQSGTEELIVLIESPLHNAQDSEKSQTLISEVEANIITHFDITPGDIMLVPRNTISKTTSGKIRRMRCLEHYHNLKQEKLIMMREPTDLDLDEIVFLCKEIYATNRKYSRSLPLFTHDFDEKFKSFMQSWLKNANSMALVSCHNNQITGFIGGYYFMDPDFFLKPACFMISFISVHPEFKQRKIASTLLKEFQARILKKYPNISQIEVEVLIGNQEAEGFWSKQNFNELKKRLVMTL
ncbi:MAG: GNAT family N-acetyltransferase [Bdellovibrio sp.]|nr:GNAT family N-acetyltransferase [Bdellovibrio sp.]